MLGIHILVNVLLCNIWWGSCKFKYIILYLLSREDISSRKSIVYPAPLLPPYYLYTLTTMPYCSRCILGQKCCVNEGITWLTCGVGRSFQCQKRFSLWMPAHIFSQREYYYWHISLCHQWQSPFSPGSQIRLCWSSLMCGIYVDHFVTHSTIWYSR